MILSIGLVYLSLASVLSIQVVVKNPPPEQIVDPEWTMIPDEHGNWHMVNTWEVLHEPELFFNADNDIAYELYTLNNPRDMQELHTDSEESLNDSNFDPSIPTVIIIHGWNSRGSVTETFQKAYFEDGQHIINLIAVNWQRGAVTMNYRSAVRRTRRAGPAISRFVDFLVRVGGMDPEKLTVIGHSLGGHIAGIVGKHVTIGLLPKIIALDPANPLFSINRPDERVAVGDARSVEIIHTAAGSLGFSAPLGDASFYPNGGRSQPGCGIDASGACAHGRAIDYFAESVNTDVGFYSLNCESYDEIRRGRCTESGDIIRMGGNPNASGVYFLETNRRAPFARGHPHAK